MTDATTDAGTNAMTDATPTATPTATTDAMTEPSSDSSSAGRSAGEDSSDGDAHEVAGVRALALAWSVDGRQVEVLLPADRELLLGRDPECDVVFDDLSVSRRHCAIGPVEVGCWQVRHISRNNPTWLNGRLIMGTAPLAAGDVLQLTIVELRVVPATVRPPTALE